MAFIETLTAAALGGGFALFGSFLTNRYNRQNAEDQRNHEKWKAKRDLYLTKGEEAYALFNQWMVNATKITTIYSFRMNGAYDANATALRLKDIDMHGTTPKITALIQIYFPVLATEFTELQQSVFEAHLFYAKNLDKAPDFTLATDLSEMGSKFATEGEVFLRKLCEAIKDYQ